MQAKLDSGEGKAELFHIVKGCLSINLGGKLFPALVDTGATISAIRASFFKGLVDLGPIQIKNCNVKIYLADNSTSVASKCVTLAFTIGTSIFEQEFKILEDLSRPMILGVDFLQKYEAHISFDNSLEFSKAIQPVVSLATFTIPPYNDVTFGGKVASPAHYTATDVGLAENWDRGEDHAVKYLVKRTLSSPNKNNDLMLTLMNCTGNAIVIETGEIVALYAPHNIDTMYAISNKKTQKASVFAEQPCVSNQKSKFQADSNTLAPSLEPDCVHLLDNKKHETSLNVHAQEFHPSKRFQPSQTSKSVLTASQQAEMDQLIEQYSDVFVGKDGALGLTHVVTHKIEIEEGAVPVSRLPYRMAPIKRERMRKAVQEQLDHGVIAQTDSGD